MFHFSSISSFFFSVDICFLSIFLRESMSRIVNLWITHELIFDHFHSFQDRLRIAFSLSNDVDMFGSKIKLLFSALDFSTEFFLVLFLFQFSNFFLMLILFPFFVSKLLISLFELGSRHRRIINFFGFSSIFLKLSSHLFIGQKCLDDTFSLFVTCF